MSIDFLCISNDNLRFGCEFKITVWVSDEDRVMAKDKETLGVKEIDGDDDFMEKNSKFISKDDNSPTTPILVIDLKELLQQAIFNWHAFTILGASSLHSTPMSSFPVFLSLFSFLHLRKCSLKKLKRKKVSLSLLSYLDLVYRRISFGYKVFLDNTLITLFLETRIL